MNRPLLSVIAAGMIAAAAYWGYEHFLWTTYDPSLDPVEQAQFDAFGTYYLAKAVHHLGVHVEEVTQHLWGTFVFSFYAWGLDVFGEHLSSIRKVIAMATGVWGVVLYMVVVTERRRPWAALGCAYAVMNRPDDARLALRQAMTLSQQKGLDPLIFYTLGYIEYYYGSAPNAGQRLDDARREFEQGVKLKETATDPFGQRVVADCEDAIAKIDQWKKTTLRLIQDFNGPDAKSIGPGWIESKNYNVQISRAGGRGKFAGKQVSKDWGLTSLSHEIAGEEFQSLEMTFFPEKVEKGEFGLSIFTSDQGGTHLGFSVGVGEGGKVRLSVNSSDRDMDGHDMAVGWTDVKVPLPNLKEITMRVTAGEKNRARYFSLWFWSPDKADWILAAKDLAMNANARVPWRIAAWVRAWKDRDVLLWIDNIKVLDQARR